MKSERHNEMEILLRRMAKQASSVSDAGNRPQAGQHLDVDELNAFAERRLPAAARARYTAHLIDCTDCRQLVAQLSAAAGLPLVEAKTETAKTSFWQRLPDFLSPAVLRFAAPALVLLAIISIGLITFRQQSSGEFVAQKQETPGAQPETNNSQTSNSSSLKAASETSSPAPASAASPLEKTEQGRQTTGAVDKVASADTTASVTVAEDKPKPSKAGEEAQPKFAPEPAAPPPVTKAQATPVIDGANKNEAVAVAKEKAAPAGEKDDAAVAQQARDERVAADREASLSRSRKAAAAGRGGTLSSVESRRSEKEEAKRINQDEVTQEVAGLRFRRQCNTWIDTAFDSAKSVTTVVRGSEQYRALVADEPGIRTIAERLGGEVVVVWKGRAYRIR